MSDLQVLRQSVKSVIRDTMNRLALIDPQHYKIVSALVEQEWPRAKTAASMTRNNALWIYNQVAEGDDTDGT
jgi:hypothetical protein